MRGLLVFGRDGQVAQELSRRAPEAVFLERDTVDLARPETCTQAIRAHRPVAVINAAAYTAVDPAESDAQTAHLVNAAAPAAMARAAADMAVPFLHISTDYVFDGTGETPWRETDATGPLGVYGATKLAGEQGVARAGGRWAVLRTSWVFSAHGGNFVKTMRRLGAERDSLSIVADQIGGPTPAAAIAEALLTMTRAMLDGAPHGGLYHFSGAPDASWADFAKAIFARTGQQVAVTPIASADYPTPARRPLNSRLDCRRIHDDFGIARPDWRKGLDDVLAELEKTA